MAKIIILILMILNLSRPLLTDKDHFNLEFEGLERGRRNAWDFKLLAPREDVDYPQQSPVDVITCKAVKQNLPELYIISDVLKSAQTCVINDGHTVEVYVADDLSWDKRPYLKGGPLNHKYVLRHLHFHWGEHDYWGSEHFIDGTGYPMEGHLVFYNSKYSSFDVAKGYKDGLAVLSVMVGASLQNNSQMDAFISRLPEIQETERVVELDNADALKWAFSSVRVNRWYFAYPGSLTTEPYSENVIWIILPIPIYLSRHQINAFRSLRDENGTNIVDNKRELQPLFNRRIVYSMKMYSVS